MIKTLLHCLRLHRLKVRPPWIRGQIRVRGWARGALSPLESWIRRARALFPLLANLLLSGFVLLPSPTTAAPTNTLNIYVWSNYFPADVLREFERTTGIKINLSEFDSNETMYTKLRTVPKIGYDIIVPSSYFVERMRREQLLHTIDHRWLPNLKNINPLLLNKPFDPENQYSIPFLWGSTGIVVNRRYWNPHSIQKWSDFWQPRFLNQLLLLDDKREPFSMALITLGYSINDQNPKHIEEAYERLRSLIPNVKLFNSDANVNIYADEDATVGLGWSGDTYLATQDNPDLTFVYPKEGFPIWIDCLSIPLHARHLENAYRFINFMLEARIAAQVTAEDGYSTGNIPGMALTPKALRDNPLINPPDSVLKQGQFQGDIGSAQQYYEKYWQLLKINT